MVNFKEIYHFSRFQRGSNYFRGGGGSNCLFPIETHITCDFPGGVRTPCPPPPSGSALDMCTLANSEDPNEMPQHAAFWQGLLCLLSPSQFSGKEIQFHLENLTCVPFDILWTIASLLYRERSDSVVE